ncbi:transporter [Pseudomonas akapageensis]|uniref:transporter n=1 Tax=Pseudomonas akapageensis TaxID=2609961 RepID=UPI00140B5219|nr:transporter [Pseudomonas akapageensis]
MRVGSSPTISAAGLGLCVLGVLTPMVSAQASGIPYASNRPQSFQFSSDFTEPYNSVGQEFEWNDDRKRFDDHGDKVDGPGTDTYVGLTSLLHYWKMDGLPNTGFIASITLPEIAVRGNGTRVSGLGDPLVGGLVWYNPTPLRTIGMQAYVQLPTGADSVSSDTYALWPSLFYDEWLGKVNIDLLVGAIIRGDGPHGTDPGNTAHANLRLGYNILDRPTYQVTPFMSVDYQKTYSSDDRDNNPITFSDSNETAVGAGVLFQLKPGIQSVIPQKTWDQVSIHYSQGVNGRNTTVTDGLFVQLWHYW